VRRMKIGQKAQVQVDAIGGCKHPGTIVSFAPGTGAQFALLAAENATGNFIKMRAARVRAYQAHSIQGSSAAACPRPFGQSRHR